MLEDARLHSARVACKVAWTASSYVGAVVMWVMAAEATSRQLVVGGSPIM